MNIIEYANENGIVDFTEVPFGEVDSLVISQLSYLKFEGIVPGPSEGKNGIVLSDVINHEKYDSIYRDERNHEINKTFFEALSKSRRFGNLILNNFIDIIDETVDVQFSAMTVESEQGIKYVVFRGTDDSIVGWKEDLNMTFKMPVPAQKYSIEYLERVASLIDGNFIVGGHSKGGNLAVYSSMNCKKDVRDRITCIYSHDGPGFRSELMEDSYYPEIADRIRKFVPKSAFFGMFGNVEDVIVVDCEKHGIRQHNPYNWLVDHFELKKAAHIGKYSMLQAEAIHTWAMEMTPDKWEALSERIFGVLEAADVNNVNEFNEDFIGTVSKIRVAAENVDEETNKTVSDILSMFRETARTVAREDAKTSVKENVEHVEKSLARATAATVKRVKKLKK